MIISPNEFNQRFGAAVIKLLQLFPFLYGPFFLLQSFFLLLSLSFGSALILQLFLGIECFLQPVDFIAVILAVEQKLPQHRCQRFFIIKVLDLRCF